MNKENKVQKIKNKMSLLTQFSATHLRLGDTNPEMNPLWLIQFKAKQSQFTTYHLDTTRANSI